MLTGEREEGDEAGPLQRDAERALVSGAGAGLAAWLDLAALGQVATQASHVLVIDLLHAVNAERAHFAPGHIAVAAPARSPGSTAGARPATEATSASATTRTWATAEASASAASRTTGAAWAVLSTLAAAALSTLGTRSGSRTGIRSRLAPVSIRVVVCLVCHIPS